ncbi:hypothetical protein [Kordia sp.]
METEIYDNNILLVIWQFILVVVLILIVYYLVKAFKMIKHIKERIDNE